MRRLFLRDATALFPSFAGAGVGVDGSSKDLARDFPVARGFDGHPRRSAQEEAWLDAVNPGRQLALAMGAGLV